MEALLMWTVVSVITQMYYACNIVKRDPTYLDLVILLLTLPATIIIIIVDSIERLTDEN